MLCTHALQAYESYNTRFDLTTNRTVQRGILINYESLPGIVAHTMLPLFGVSPSESWLNKMKEESKHYSKSRGSIYRLFFGDSEDKESRATESIQLYANRILQPSYTKLLQIAKLNIALVSPEQYESLIDPEDPEKVRWDHIKQIPASIPRFVNGKGQSAPELNAIVDDGYHILHSPFKKAEFIPWAPFANHHNSVRKEVSLSFSYL